MKIFRSFFKLHQSGILAFVLCSIVFVLIFSLYDLPVGAVLYSAVLSAVICLALFLASFIRYCKRCRMLQKMQQEITVTIQHLPQPQDCKEQAYQELLKRLFQKQQEQAQAWQVRCSDMMEYYTAWTQPCSCTYRRSIHRKTVPCWMTCSASNSMWKWCCAISVWIPTSRTISSPNTTWTILSGRRCAVFPPSSSTGRFVWNTSR